MLSAHDRERYGRQLRLPEVGVEGQQRLLDATFSVQDSACATVAPNTAPNVAQLVAQDYLERAGLTSVQDDPGANLTGLGDQAISALCPDAPYLEEAAAALAGAFAAVETIKAVVRAGTPAHFPTNFTLAQET